MREAAWGGGLFLIAERPGVSGDGDSRSTRPYDTAALIKRNSALSDHPLSLSIGPSSTSLTRCHQRQITTIYFGEIGELRPAISGQGAGPRQSSMVALIRAPGR